MGGPGWWSSGGLDWNQRGGGSGAVGELTSCCSLGQPVAPAPWPEPACSSFLSPLLQTSRLSSGPTAPTGAWAAGASARWAAAGCFSGVLLPQCSCLHHRLECVGCDTQRGGQRPFTSHRRWLSFPIVLPLAPCSPPTCPGVQGVAAWRAAGGGQSAEHFLGHAAGGLRWKALSWRCAASPACPCCRGHLQSGTLAPEPGAAGYACLLVTAGQLAYPPCAKMRPACPAAGAGRLPPGDCNPQGKSSTELLCIYRCLLAGHLLRQ